MNDVRTIHDPDLIDFEKPGKSMYEVAFHYDGTWGNTLVPMTVINGTAGAGKSLVCFGGTHGNEYEGQVAVWRLMHELDPSEISGRVILIPRLNVPACDAGTRESPQDGVNMNRAFPGDLKGTLTYRISNFVTSKIFPLVDVVLDIHSAGSGPEFALCSSFHQIDDPQQYAEMKYVASLFDTPFIMVYSSEMASGLLTDEAEAMGKITIGSELGHSCGVLHQGLQHAYQGIKNVLHHYQILPGEIQKIDHNRETPPKLVAAIHLDEYIPAPISGVFEPILKVGNPVECGQLVGRVYDFERVGSRGLEIYAPRSGYLLLQTFQAPVKKGDTMLVIAQEVID
ncbi:MAG: succinylglutamate desuccinylase/aspartoacylase family protein [Candidatus Poribacteria bacterium]|nr:succinylglutamate desuccinylase/aspartoacylase family protein [Candidatus Poribacteria bacterium]